MQLSPLFGFIIKVFVYLPVCYWGWYLLAEQTTGLVVYSAQPILQFLFPTLIEGIEQTGYTLEVVVNVTVAAENVPRGMIAELPIPLNPLIYSYGLPLALALILASPFNFAKTLRNILLSILLFQLIQIWGVCFESMKVLFLQTPPELIGNISLASWQLDIVALGYQLGVLVLPTVVPIIIWLSFYQDFIALLTPALQRKISG